MPSAGFEPTIIATKRPQTYALHCAATDIGIFQQYSTKGNSILLNFIEE
jgi:hypothetical protein